MSARSLNKVTLIGNLTRDPELRYTPSGTAVCTFGLATNRSWTTQTGETREETEFHRIVAWNRLGELCAQLLQKGRKVYVEGRIATHTWTGQDGNQRTTTEIIIEDMILLDSRKIREEAVGTVSLPAVEPALAVSAAPADSTVPVSQAPQDDQATAGKKEAKKPPKSKQKEEKKEEKGEETGVSESTESEVASEDITPDDIPF